MGGGGTISKRVQDVAVGDVIESADGFDLCYIQVESIEIERNAKGNPYYVLYGSEDGEDGMLYPDDSETLEVVVFPLERFGASISRNENPNPAALPWQVWREGHGFMYADTLGGAVRLARHMEVTA